MNETNASQISQNDNAIKTVVANLNKDANGNTYTSISGLYQTAESIQSTVTANKADADSAISQVSQKADNVRVTIENKLNNTDPSKSAYKSISQLSQTADEIKSTVQTNKSSTDNAISQVSQKADNVKVTIENKLNNTDPSKSAYKSITQLQTNINGVSTTVQNNKSATDTEISQIKQNANSLSSTVQTYHTDANNKITGLSTKITQNADKITSVVTNLSDSEKAKNNYSAIAQLIDDVNLRVAKGDVINQINISKESILIDGNKVHITGDTKFDKNVIVGGMIAANSITADKLSANTMELTASQGIKGGGATLNANGLTVRGSDGSYVVHGSNGMEFHDGNGNTFAMVGAMIMGTVKDGQWVKFTKPWKTVPNVIVTPISLQTAIAGYTSTNLYLDCRPQNVTVNGFQAVCRTVLKAGSGGTIPVNKLVTGSTGNSGTYTYNGIEITIPEGATTFTNNITWKLVNKSKESGRDSEGDYHYFEGGNAYLDVKIDVNEINKVSKRLCSAPQSWNKDTYSGIDSLPVEVSSGAKVKIYFVLTTEKTLANGFGQADISITINNYTFNTTADVALASGNAFFLCTDRHNSPYTISNSQ